MIVIYPVTLDTVDSIDLTARVLKALGPNAMHRALIASCPSTMAEAQLFHEQIRLLFRTIEVVALPEEWTLQDRTQRNRTFAAVCAHLRSQSNTDPFIWMERMCPIKPDWLNAIEAEYRLMQRQHLGDIQPTYFSAGKAADGSPLFREEYKHMRAGVYGPNLVNSVILPFLHKQFEINLQYEIVPQAVESRTIKTIYASANFTMTPDKIRGEKTTESAIRKRIEINIRDGDVALVHGCRDGSLERLILKQYGDPIARAKGLDDIKELAAQRREELAERGVPPIPTIPMSPVNEPIESVGLPVVAASERKMKPKRERATAKGLAVAERLADLERDAIT